MSPIDIVLLTACIVLSALYVCLIWTLARATPFGPRGHRHRYITAKSDGDSVEQAWRETGGYIRNAMRGRDE